MTEKENQQKVVKEKIHIQAVLSVRAEGTKVNNNLTYSERVEYYEKLFLSLCEMYRIAYS